MLHAREQIGGQGRTEQQMDGFREAVAFCGLSDLGYIGLPNTWDNREQDGNNTKVRLDRGLVSAEFLNLFSTVKVWHVQTTESDHCSLVLECSQTEGRRNKKKRTIRYENMWRRDTSYTSMVESAWNSQVSSTSLCQLAAKLGQVSTLECDEGVGELFFWFGQEGAGAFARRAGKNSTLHLAYGAVETGEATHVQDL